MADLTMLRHFGATLALTPWVMLRPSAPAGRLKWGKALVLLALAGPHRGALYTIGMPLTRLSHAVVISPGFSMIVAFVLSAAAVGRWPEARRVCGLNGRKKVAIERPQRADCVDTFAQGGKRSFVVA